MGRGKAKSSQGRGHSAAATERGRKASKSASNGARRSGERGSSASAATSRSRATKKAANKKAASTKKAATKKAASTKTTATKKAASTKTAPKKATAKKATTKKATAKKADGAASAGAQSAVEAMEPVRARPSREDRRSAEAKLDEIDLVMGAWADLVAERIAADQTFASLVEEFHGQPRDLRGLFLWDALQAAESHVAMINDVLAEHIVDRRADPVAILEELRRRRKRTAAVYAVNAFLAVLNQMKAEKPAWLQMDAVDSRFAVLALAHQTLGYALEAAGVEAPPDLTDHIIVATQDEAVWVWRRMPEPGTDTLAACAAAAAFFRALGSDTMIATDEVAALYGEHGRSRGREAE